MWTLAAHVVLATGTLWWLKVGLRRAKRAHYRWRVEHGWKCAHLVARPGGDRLLDCLLAALLVPLGPLVPPCNRQRVLLLAHLFLFLVFGAAPQVPRTPVTPAAIRPVPALHVYPPTVDESAYMRKA